jgi:hypothetical protein
MSCELPVVALQSRCRNSITVSNLSSHDLFYRIDPSARRLRLLHGMFANTLTQPLSYLNFS